MSLDSPGGRFNCNRRPGQTLIPSLTLSRIILGLTLIAIEGRDKWQRTPVLWATLHNQTEMLKALLAAKGSPDLFVKHSYHARRTSARFESPLHAAARLHGGRSFETLHVLLEANA